MEKEPVIRNLNLRQPPQQPFHLHILQSLMKWRTINMQLFSPERRRRRCGAVVSHHTSTMPEENKNIHSKSAMEVWKRFGLTVWVCMDRRRQFGSHSHKKSREHIFGQKGWEWKFYDFLTSLSSPPPTHLLTVLRCCHRNVRKAKMIRVFFSSLAW